MNFKDIHIGQLIRKGVLESEIEISRICKFLNCSEEQINEMYASQSLDSEILLKWSKILEYDFFRIYTQHLILYAPARVNNQSEVKPKLSLPVFKKIFIQKKS